MGHKPRSTSKQADIALPFPPHNIRPINNLAQCTLYTVQSTGYDVQVQCYILIISLIDHMSIYTPVSVVGQDSGKVQCVHAGVFIFIQFILLKYILLVHHIFSAYLRIYVWVSRLSYEFALFYKIWRNRMTSQWCRHFNSYSNICTAHNQHYN